MKQICKHKLNSNLKVKNIQKSVKQTSLTRVMKVKKKLRTGYFLETMIRQDVVVSLNSCLKLKLNNLILNTRSMCFSPGETQQQEQQQLYFFPNTTLRLRTNVAFAKTKVKFSVIGRVLFCCSDTAYFLECGSRVVCI